MANKTKKEKVPTWLIVVGFMMGFWPGAVLLGIRLIQESNEKENGKARTDVEWEYLRQEAARKSQQRTYNAQGQRTYSSPSGEYARKEGESAEDYARRIAQAQRTILDKSTPIGGTNADGTYRYVYKTAKTTSTTKTTKTAKTAKTAKTSGSLLDDSKLSAKIGKGMKLAGNIVLGVGLFITAVTFLSLLVTGAWITDIIGATSLTALCCCTPGLVLSIIGNKKHNRIMRCRTYAAMIGLRKKIEIDELAEAIPTRYSKCVDDLQWMLGEGMLKGMYIDGTDRVLTYPDAEDKPARPAKTCKNGETVYAEEERIRALNDQIVDDYVSQRMDRLEELTHKILSYAEEHPEKESSLRQFRNHYLPKTFSILESYARMERMGVEGGNISSAMKDVEAIMDKLVLGFEKQLDALFDSEALDVTTDVNVLENMMTMEGLSDLDPFGSLKKDEELRKY
ncbi:MAG: 5-bromo-4-chloroindolyl phosphate hydrolysis family protein [Clostridia bacterium]|nr:5-bromo-4-chloroindolyl phosphate hydrolysis family protein [Clostridia bacterium]